MLRMSKARRPLRGAPSVAELIRSKLPCASVMWRALLLGDMHAIRMLGIALPAHAIKVKAVSHEQTGIRQYLQEFSSGPCWLVTHMQMLDASQEVVLLSWPL